MNKAFCSILFFILLSAFGGQLSAEDLEGYWKYSEASIQEITDFTLESRRSGKSSGDSSAAEITDAYRNHIRQFSITDGNGIHIQLIQFERNDDPYPEYIRSFHFDYEAKENQFSIKSGEKEIFTGHIEDNILYIKDSSSGSVLKMVPLAASEVPILSKGNLSQPKLDRQPKPRKMATPEYPPNLERQGIGGIVQLSFYVNVDGSTSEIRVLSSQHPGLERAAIDAILESTFHPGRANRKAVRTHVKLPITFR
jgi:TonB family protein